MVVNRLLIALAIVVALVACSAGAMAASADESLKIDRDIILAANPAGISFNIVPMSLSYITQGNTNVHYWTISGFVTRMEVDLNWGNPANSLRLSIRSPAGSLYGPYYDGFDNSLDGRIHLYVTNPDGLAQGTWDLSVYGHSVTGTQSYTIYTK